MERQNILYFSKHCATELYGKITFLSVSYTQCYAFCLVIKEAVWDKANQN